MQANITNSKDKSPVVERFLRYKLVIQGRSKKTVEEYGLDLRTFFRFLIAMREGISPNDEEFNEISIACVDEEFIKTIKTIDILEFMAYTAQARGNSAAARSRKLSALRMFFKYMTVSEKVIELNPAADIESPKKKKSLPKHLSVVESKDLLHSVVADEESKNRDRDYCIITLFLNCGLRLSELVGINLSDIDREMRSLRVLGKGNKERIVYLNEACKSALSAYLLVRARDITNIKDKDKNALFISRLGKRISVKTVQWLVYKYLDQAGLSYKHFSTHKLRHTAATLMYQEGGVDVLSLKEILGHSELNTTQIYTHVSDRKLEEAVESHPLANIMKDDVK
ncbi:MAG: tyrosine-type recombinase/integrase [Clostridia bacterium]|nr:tyrosine-type recombinase/integrase [Clostridia bacterium]